MRQNQAAYQERKDQMHKRHIIYLLVFTLIPYLSCYSQERIVYKQVDTVNLYMEVYLPASIDRSLEYPAIVFYFGGGWNNGSIDQFAPHAVYFSRRGMVCFLVDYRVRSRHQSSPFESLKDAKSAIRYIREHAGQFHVDTSRIVASGGSAGGHLAAATALTDGYNENTDKLSVSCKPNALVLFNPVIDNGPGGYGYERIGEAYKDFSPLHNIKKNAPPTILFLGTNDALVPVETARYYQKAMEIAGSRCELQLYEGEPHGFFNYRNFENYRKTVSQADTFLQSIGYLKSKPLVTIE